MRIAWFSHRYYPCIGGSENYGRAMVRRFVETGHEADVFTTNAHDLWYFTDPTRKQVDAPRVSRVDGARVERLPVRHFPLQRYFGKLASYAPHWPTRCRTASYMPILPSLNEIRGEYDAVFAVAFPYTVFSYAALRLARSSGAPLILTPFLHLSTPGDPVNRGYTKSHQRRLLREADLVVVPTEREASVINGWKVPRDRILTMGMAVEHEAVTGGDREGFRNRLSIPADARVVGHLATLDPNKGSIDLVHAVARLNETRADQPIRLVMAGASSPHFEQFLAEYPGGIPSWLIVTGTLSTEDRANLFAAMDVFSMPSRTDSYGIVFLEAWANGLPVVAADAGGVPEVVKHEQNGLLVPFGAVDELSQALARYVDDPEHARTVGEAGREGIARGFTWDDRFRTLYAQTQLAISRRRRRAPGMKDVA
ncbi:glycosyltransferase family 4 protein [Singulisphaera sp. PoT]|uniref:glycosyltransferase family 4 protein n=1 Tax=Singulisphaera sp. PoT TaxID=3411797 RepID=UPI003BF46804